MTIWNKKLRRFPKVSAVLSGLPPGGAVSTWRWRCSPATCAPAEGNWGGLPDGGISTRSVRELGCWGAGAGWDGMIWKICLTFSFIFSEITDPYLEVSTSFSLWRGGRTLQLDSKYFLTPVRPLGPEEQGWLGWARPQAWGAGPGVWATRSPHEGA